MAALVFLFFASCDDERENELASSERGESELAALATHEPTATLELPAAIDYLAVGGGAEPASSQVSLEQDLALLRDILGEAPGVVLHAGGPGAASTHELHDDDEPPGDPLLSRLGELLDPRESRRARFRESAISPNGPSSRVAFEHALARGLDGNATTPLLVYLNGHGDLADVDADNAVLLWGAEPLTAFRLSQLLDGATRPVRVVVTSCYSGGFAELAFAGADPTRGPTTQPLCGLFATTPDRESSGCDPNPERSEQEGFALHFLNALAGRDRGGSPLPSGEIDFDGDGVITLYEAHARARIAGRSIDIPTTTSERWLRHAVDIEDGGASGSSDERASPVEARVARALGAALSLPDAESAERRLAELASREGELTEQLEEVRADADAAWTAFRIGLLERWPILDDPWDARLVPTVREHRDEIARYLDESPAARDYRETREAITAVDDALVALDDEVALVTRLVRAHENIRLEALLRARGGEAQVVFDRLRACESTPLISTRVAN